MIKSSTTGEGRLNIQIPIRMKNYNFLLFLLCFLIFECNNGKLVSPESCQEFKNGIFESFSDTLRIISQRKGKVQVERTALGNSKYEVTWKSDCEYELKLLQTEMEIAKNNIGRIYKVKITGTSKNQYSYECSVDGFDFVDIGTLKRIEN